jgi:hypothetical protein
MKTLYESILDDEEVLIEKTREIAKNPFSRLYNLRPEDWLDEKLLLEIIRVLEMPETVYTHSVTRTGNSSSEERFKPECLGVESFLFNKPGHPRRYNERWLCITYDMLKHRDPSKKSLNPYKLVEIMILGEGDEYENKNFLHDGRIFVKIYSKIDVKTIFGSISSITKLFKKWNKSYGVMIQ